MGQQVVKNTILFFFFKAVDKKVNIFFRVIQSFSFSNLFNFFSREKSLIFLFFDENFYILKIPYHSSFFFIFPNSIYELKTKSPGKYMPIFLLLSS